MPYADGPAKVGVSEVHALGEPSRRVGLGPNKGSIASRVRADVIISKETAFVGEAATLPRRSSARAGGLEPGTHALLRGIV